MAQKYKVFINDQPIFFHTDDKSVEKQPGGSILHSDDKAEIEQFIQQNLSKNARMHIVGKIAFENHFSDYKKVVAAGGLVFNDKGEYLLIFRNEKWDLPKGKVEKGETIEDAAIREVEEECGVQKLMLTKHLVDTWHTYEMRGKKHLKITHWFLMTTNYSGKLTPQTGENITKVEWRNTMDLKDIFENTYGSIRDVLNTLF